MDIAAYRKQQIKEVEVPSGFKFVVRQMTPKAFMKVTAYLPKPTETVNVEEAAGDAFMDNFYDIIKAVLPECVLEPKVTLEPSDDSLGIDEISFSDAQALIFEIFSMSEIIVDEGTQDKMEKRGFFR